ncbi:MAG: AAA family ATPase [Hyphomonadaceae bacterium]|nr:AAA family ATPase [Hyphomonadaceae bacterium]
MTPLDKPLKMTRFPSRKGKSKQSLKMSLRELSFEIQRTERETKEQLPSIKLQTYGDKRSEHGSLRNNANVRTVTGLEIDYDCNGESAAAKKITMERARKIFERAEVAALIVPSASYSHDNPSWHAYLPFRSEREPAERDRYASWVNGLFDGEIDQHASFTLSQASFYGRPTGADHPAPVFAEGRYIDDCDDLDAGALPKRTKPRERDGDRDRERVKDGSGSAALFNLARECVFSKDREGFTDAVAADADASAHVERQADAERALNRAWAKARIHKHAREAAIAGKSNGQFLATVAHDPDIIDLSKDEISSACDKEWKAAPDVGFDSFGDEDSNSASPFLPIMDWKEAAKVPRRQMLYAGSAYTRGYVSATIGPGGMGKSSCLVSEVMAMISGVNLIGDAPDGPLRVCYWQAEDDMEEQHRRFHAARIEFESKIEGTGYEGRLVVKAVDSPLVVAHTDRGAVILNKKLIKKFVAWLIKLKIDVLIVDPFIATHAVQGNDNDAIGKIVRGVWGRIAKEANCAVMLVHHTRKGAPGQTDYRVDDSLGAGAMIAACRYARVLNKMSPEEAPKLGVAPSDAWAYFRVDSGKANLAPLGAAVWRHLKSVPLNNGSFEKDDGDRIGVTVAWEPPDIASTTDAERAKIVAAMSVKPEWREHALSKKDWVGEAFAQALGLDLDDPQAKAEVKAKIKAALQAGWLIRGAGKNEERKPVPIVKVRPKRSLADLLGSEATP